MKDPLPSGLISPNLSRSEVYWKGLLWCALVVSLTFYLFGSAVNVHWGNTPIPLTQAIGTIRWERVLQVWSRDIRLLAFVAAVLCATCFTLASSWKTRLALVLAGFVVPAALMGEGAVASLFFGPITLFSFLAGGGTADGEFYIEGMPQFAAIGVWMLSCIVLTVREIRIAFKEVGRAEFQRHSSSLDTHS